MKTKTVLLALALMGFFSASGAGADEKNQWRDEDGDGKNETRVFLSDDVTTRIEKDKNGDGKNDRTTWFRGGKRHKSEEDTNFDGQADKWEFYTEEGSLFRAEKDNNFDGKPDDFKKLLRGRDIVLKEADRNFDGKIDKRLLTRWDPERRLAGQVIPSYITMTREEDNDYDGKIDVYSERGNPEAAPVKMGQLMSTAPDTADPTKPAPTTAGPEEQGTKKLIRQMNEKYGLSE